MSLFDNPLADLYVASLPVRVLTWFCWGALLKAIDLHFDDGLFRLGFAILLCVLGGLTAGVAMAVHSDTCLIYGAIVLAMMVNGKVDNYGFVLSVVILALVLLAAIFSQGFPYPINFRFGALLTILVAVYSLEEWCHDITDARRVREAARTKRPGRWRRLLEFVLLYRNLSVALDIVILITGVMPLSTIIMANALTPGYYAMAALGRKLRARAA